MTQKLFVKSQTYSNAFELATITKKIIELIPNAGFKTDQARDRIYTQMANIVKRQLEVVSKNNLIDAKSMKADSLTLLINSVELLVQKLPASQANLMNSIKVGILRNIADTAAIANKEQTFKSSSFSASQIRRTDSRTNKSASLASLKVVSADSKTATVTIPEASAFAKFNDIIVQAVLFKDQLTDFAGYKPLVLDVTMYSGMTNSGDIMISPIKISDLDQEIKIGLPIVSDRKLTCAFFDET